MNFALIVTLLSACESQSETGAPAAQTEGNASVVATSERLTSGSQQLRGPVSEGEKAYGAFNCAGCHGGSGGGGIGPPLSDDEWIYGSSAENIAATIVEGRPNGMPPFREAIDEARLGHLVAFVRSMSGLEPEPAATP